MDMFKQFQSHFAQEFGAAQKKESGVGMDFPISDMRWMLPATDGTPKTVESKPMTEQELAEHMKAAARFMGWDKAPC